MHRTGEEGFALISAVWLLTLAAAIAALLMLQSLRQTRELVAVQGESSAQQDMDDVLAQVVAAMIFQGPSSPWGRAPSSGRIDIGNRHADIAIDRESARLDINKAPLADIDDLLHDKGFPPEQRAALLARVGEARATHRLIGTFADVLALGQDAMPAANRACLPALLSPFGGMQVGQSPLSADFAGSSPVRSGDTIRVAIDANGRRRVAVLRMIGSRAEPYSVLDWYDDLCRQGRTA